MALPISQTNILPLSLMQNTWAAQLNPVLANLLVQGSLLSSVPLVSGANIINHRLGKLLTSYFVRKRQYLISGTPTAYDIYDTQISNNTPQLTLNLTCSEGTTANPVLVDIWVF
jgi:hypothetical protein